MTRVSRQSVVIVAAIFGALLAATSTARSRQDVAADSNAAALHEQPYWVEEVATDLDLPRALAWLPNGDMLLTEWAGTIRVIRDGKTIGRIEGVPRVYLGFYDGLRDIKLDPDFASNHLVYLTLVDGSEHSRVGRVFRARLEGHRLVDGNYIFTVTPPMPEVAGPLMMRMLFLPDKTLLVGVGSGDQVSIALVQRSDVHIGKVIRINRDGSVPKDNPQFHDLKMLPEIWALGLRNASGIARTDDGKLWAVDIGPKGGDELDELRPGANYGWPLVTWGFDYSGRAMSTRQSAARGFTDAVLTWVPAFTPSDLVQYRGETYPFWNGDLFVTGLSGKSVRRLRLRNGEVVLQETMLSHLNERWRSVSVGPDNLIYLLTDAYGEGRILRLRPGAPTAAARIAKSLFGSSADETERRKGAPLALAQKTYSEARAVYRYDADKSAQAFAQFCAGCHSFGRFKYGHVGPDLDGVDGRRSGSSAGYAYSAAFTDPAHQLVWNDRTLFGFLQQPQVYFPGTAMSVPALPATTIQQIVDFLTNGMMGQSQRRDAAEAERQSNRPLVPNRDDGAR